MAERAHIIPILTNALENISLHSKNGSNHTETWLIWVEKESTAAIARFIL